MKEGGPAHAGGWTVPDNGDWGAVHGHSHATLLSSHLWQPLGWAIGLLSAQIHPPDEILIVTDHNRESFDPYRAPWPEVRVLESTGPPELSGACDAAVEACATEVIEFLHDAVATVGWLVGADT